MEAGKTILASLVVHEAQKLPHNPKVLFFYCKHENAERNNFVAIGRSFLAQLHHQDRDLTTYLYQKYCDSSEPVLNSLSLLEEFLLLAFEGCQSGYIIIDGLDECSRDQRKVITQWFRQLIEDLPTSEPDRLRCLFISQNDGSGRKDLAGLPSISIKAEHSLHDIELFNQIELHALRELLELPDEVAGDIIDLVNGENSGIIKSVSSAQE
jgi:NACHT domain